MKKIAAGLRVEAVGRGALLFPNQVVTEAFTDREMFGASHEDQGTSHVNIWGEVPLK